MIRYVHRPAGPNTPISWAGEYAQPGYAEEALDDATSAELRAFLNPPALVLAAKLAAGCTIVSTGASPNVSGLWALDDKTQQQIATVATSAAQFGLPRNRSTFAYPDAAGTPHELTVADLGVLFVTLRDYIDELYETAATLEAGGPAEWPPTPVAIA